MFGVRFSFVATRSGLTRVRHYNADDLAMKKEALAFAKRHARAVDETYYSRTVDYNMLLNETAAVIQVPFNTHLKIAERLRRYELESHLAAASNYADGTEGVPGNAPRPASVRDMSLFEKLEILSNSSLHVIATQSVIANEGAQRTVAAVVGVFYDYAAFVGRLLNATNGQFGGPSGRAASKKPAHCYLANAAGDGACDESKAARCGYSNDTIDCLLVDNNGYILASEDLAFIGRHLRAYDPVMMARLVGAGVFHELNITDYQSICQRQEERQTASSGRGPPFPGPAPMSALVENLFRSLAHLKGVAMALAGLFVEFALSQQLQASQPQPQPQPMWALLPNKTYLRPCDRVLTRYETRPGQFSSEAPEFYTDACQCPAWFVYEQVPRTNLLLIVADSTPACRSKCKEAPAGGQPEQEPEQGPEQGPGPARDDSLNTQYNVIGATEQSACSMFEREAALYKRKLATCISHHPDEDNIKLCGAGQPAAIINRLLLLLAALLVVVSHQLNLAPTSFTH